MGLWKLVGTCSVMSWQLKIIRSDTSSQMEVQQSNLSGSRDQQREQYAANHHPWLNLNVIEEDIDQNTQSISKRTHREKTTETQSVQRSPRRGKRKNYPPSYGHQKFNDAMLYSEMNQSSRPNKSICIML